MPARCERLGIGAHLAKPVKQSRLMDAVVNVLGKSKHPMEKSAMAEIPPQRPLRILLAEDNAVNQRLAVVNLESWGHAVTVAHDGREVVEAFSAQPFDLVLMDAQMPRMNGFEAAAEIRRREGSSGGHVPIIAMTANVMKGYREECLAAGMDGYVAKPMRRQELLQEIASVISGFFVEKRSVPEAKTPEVSEVKATEVPVATVPVATVPVATVPTAVAPPPQAADTAASTPAPVSSVLDGNEAGTERGHSCPPGGLESPPSVEIPPTTVVAPPQAADPSPSLRADAASTPAPVAPAPAPVAPPPAPIASTPVPVAPALAPAPPRAVPAPSPDDAVFDSAAVLSSLDGNRAMVSEMIRLCLEEDAPRLLGDLRNALETRDLTAVEQSAHGLKGLVGEFHAPGAYAAARRLEEAGRNHETERVPFAAHSFFDEFDRLAAALRRFSAG